MPLTNHTTNPMTLSEETIRQIMREMGRKGGKANTRENLVKAGKRSAEVRRLNKALKNKS